MSSNSVFGDQDPIDPFAGHGAPEAHGNHEPYGDPAPPAQIRPSAAPAQRRPAAPGHQVPAVHELLAAVIESIETARPVPLSAAVKVDADPILDMLYEAVERLPDELREARWLLREREEFLAGVEREGDEITAIARSRAELMVDRTELVKASERRAQRILSDAESQARQMRRETEDFCDARLASLEGILDRTRTVVVTGRTRLQGSAPIIDLTDEPEVAVDEAVPSDVPDTPRVESRAPLFDQDLS